MHGFAIGIRKFQGDHLTKNVTRYFKIHVSPDFRAHTRIELTQTITTTTTTKSDDATHCAPLNTILIV